jgi:hypothetical protein
MLDIYIPDAFHMLMMNVFEKSNVALIMSPLPFVRGVALVKIIKVKTGRRSGAPCFLYVASCV